MSQAHQHTDMRIMLQSIASLACLSIAVATPGTATPLYPGLSGAAQMESSTRVVLVAKKEKQTKRGNYNGSQGYIPGHVRTPYGYSDCIGWWERHPNGRMQCHGQLIRDR